MRYLSLFSGIEAASVAWMPLGWTCVAVAENEKFPSAVLNHHYPDVANLGDVTTITEEQIRSLGSIDLVVGGFPCQDVSVAGKRKGLKNADGTFTRSGLFFDAMRIIEWAKPRWTVVENVPGLFSSNGGRDFAAVAGELAGCKFDVPREGWRTAGFALGKKGLVEWRVLDAQFFGLAQRRNRVFLVRDSGDWTNRPPLLLERESLRWNPPKGRETREGLAPTISARVKGGDGLGTDAECDGAVIPIQELGKRQSGTAENGVGHGAPGEPMFTLQSGAVHGVCAPIKAAPPSQRNGGSNPTADEFVVCATLTKNYATHHGRTAGNNGGVAAGQLVPSLPMARVAHPGGRLDSESETLIPVVAHSVSAGRDGYNDGSDQTYVPVAFSAKDYGGDAGELAPTLRAGTHDSSHANGGVMPAVAFQPRVARNGHGNASNQARALQATSTGTGDAAQCVASTAGVRRLTPTECERLQGFPDGYTAIPWRGKPADQCPDGPRYRALGNSMAVPVMRWIGDRILLVEKLST